MSSDYPYIVADIGGTNARFGLVTKAKDCDKGFAIENKQKYPSADFENIEQAVRHYLKSINGEPISGACLAVAGPVNGDQIHLTNLDWSFSTLQLQHDLRLSKLSIINDFAAYAFATQYVEADDLLSLNEGQSTENQPIAIVGPGTGFGVAALVSINNKRNVLPTEGGHMTLASNTQLQSEVITVLKQKFSRVSIERVLSGTGLGNLYCALGSVESIEITAKKPSEITEKAVKDNTSLEYRTLDLFCSWLGYTCGDLALALGARGGLYLGGGVLKRFPTFFMNSQFMTCFLDKEPMQAFLHQTPVKLVIESNSALVGAAAWYRN